MFVDILHLKLEAVMREFERPWKKSYDVFENNILLLSLSRHKAVEHSATT
jgi:hypothetical protein